MPEYQLNVCQEEGRSQHLFVVQCGAVVDVEILKIAGLLLDGGFAIRDLKELSGVAGSYVSVKTVDDLSDNPLAVYRSRLRQIGVIESLTLSRVEREYDRGVATRWYMHIDEKCHLCDTWEEVEATARKHVSERDKAKAITLKSMT